jgi:antitoxin (DNA-binding transcriptional repressor) of toxin-antitoxin stability system
VKRIELNKQPEVIKQFLQSLAVDPEGVLLESNGQPLARVVPIPSSRPTKSGSLWSSDQEDRREFLIDRELEGSLTPEETEELKVLQRQMNEYLHRLDP